MKYLLASVMGQRISIDPAAPTLHVAGTVGLYGLQFSFDQEWENLTPVAVFSSDCLQTPIAMTLTNNRCDIPWEAVAEPGNLYVGVIGLDTNHQLRVTTTSDSNVVIIKTPTATYERVSPTPTPGLFEQLQAQIGNLSFLQTTAKNNLVVAINEVFANRTTKTYVDAQISLTKSYADTKANTAESNAKTYSDTNLVTAKAYSDANLATAKNYADTKANAAESNAKSYADTVGTTSVATSEAYTDTVTNKTVMSGQTSTSDASTVTLTNATVNVATGTTGSSTEALPVASASSAGVMNAATYQGWVNNTNDINAIKHGAVAISNISANPSQSDLTTAWMSATGLSTLINSAKIYDVTNQKTWTYFSNTQTWYPAGVGGGSVVVNQWTNSSLGTVLGSQNDGQIFAETDGTGSVNGWDTLKGRVTTAESDIDTAEANITTLQGSMTTAETNITALQGDMTTAETNITTLQGDMTTANTNITALQNAGYQTSAQVDAKIAAQPAETWTFTLADGTTTTKTVVIKSQ